MSGLATICQGQTFIGISSFQYLQYLHFSDDMAESARPVKGVCVFNEEWLGNDKVKQWIARSTCETEFWCSFCRQSFKLCKYYSPIL